jgi:hypothetical protein
MPTASAAVLPTNMKSVKVDDEPNDVKIEFMSPEETRKL